jgi:hypothetical protein
MYPFEFFRMARRHFSNPLGMTLGIIFFLFGSRQMVVFAARTAVPPSPPRAAGLYSSQTISYSKAIVGLACGDWASQQKWQSAAEQAFISQLRAMVRLAGPEQRARVVRVLEFQEGLLRWVEDTEFQPMAETSALAKFWLRGKHADLIAEMFSDKPNRRALGLARVAKIPGWQADAVLGWQLHDLAGSNTLIVSAAANGLAERTPGEELIHSVSRYYLGLKPSRARAWVNVLGKEYFARVFRQYNRRQLTNLLSLLLLHWHSNKLARSLDEALGMSNYPLLRPLKDIGTCTFGARLILAVKPKDAVPALLAMVHQPFIGAVFPQPDYWDYRTAALYVLIRFIGKKPADYHFRRVTGFQGGTSPPIWCVTSRSDQRKDIVDVTRWCQAHGLVPKAPPPWTATPVEPTTSEIRKWADAADLQIGRSLGELGASRFQVRRQACLQLRKGITGQLRALVLAEARSRWQNTWPLIDFEYGFTRWTLLAMEAPKTLRQRELRWGFMKANRSLAADAYSQEYYLRAKAAKLLSRRRNDPIAMRLLADMLMVRTQYVFLHAAITVNQIGPTSLMVRRLYQGCQPPGVNNIQTQPPGRQVVLLGWKMSPPPIHPPIDRFHEVDARILERWKPAIVSKLLVDTLANWLAQSRKNGGRLFDVQEGLGTWRGFMKLFAIYHPRAAVPYLLKLVHTTDDWSGSFSLGGVTYFHNIQTNLLLLLIQTAGKNPKDFGMARTHSSYVNRWGFKSTQQQEAAIQAMTIWWAKNPSGRKRPGK